MVVLSGTFFSFGFTPICYLSDYIPICSLVILRSYSLTSRSELGIFANWDVLRAFCLGKLAVVLSHRTVDLKLPKEMENGIRTIEALPQDAEIKPMNARVDRRRNTAEESPASNQRRTTSTKSPAMNQSKALDLEVQVVVIWECATVRAF